MKIIGLSGGIASGKNFVAEIFARNGAVIFDADKEAHKLLESDEETIVAIAKFFPQAVVNQQVSRKILGEIVFNDENKLKTLERMIHPKIRKKYQEFIEEAKKNKVELAVLNIPLLLESDEYKCDKIIAIIVPESIRKQRFLLRAKENDVKNLYNLEDRFAKIAQRQIGDFKREQRADFIIRNNLTKDNTIAQVQNIIYEIKKD